MNQSEMTEQTPVLFGEVLYDCFDDGSRVLGGAPFNVAWHLQAFGCAPLFISRVGDDPLGRRIRDVMQDWGMSAAGLQLDSAHPTGEVQVSLREGQPSFEILSGRAYDHIQADALPPMQPSLIYHGSLGLREADSAAALEALLSRHPAPIFMDVNLRPPWWRAEQLGRLLDQARWVKINDDELETLVAGDADLQGKARELIRRHDLSWVIVTRGAQGAFALDREGGYNEIAPHAAIHVVDTVGAGDAFASVCILGLLQEWSIPLIMERAQQFASLLVGQRGATISDPEVYRVLRMEWQLGQ
jgi:fructokinase